MSAFNIEDGIPVAQRQNREASAARLGGGRRIAGIPFASQIAISGFLLLVMASVVGVLLAGGGVSPISSGDPPSTNTSSPDPERADPETLALQSDPPDLPLRDSILGHFEYVEADANTLRTVGSFNGRTEQLQTAAADRFLDMQTKAQQSGIRLAPISGFRSREAQKVLFFQVGQSQALTPQERALVSAPPGYSEHHTGYAIDIGDANHPQTHLQTTFDSTPAFRWLQANAAHFGFELSFPKDNQQGVSYEPWHWRFVGDSPSLETFYSTLDRSSQREISVE